jgi:hypothetical protein
MQPENILQLNFVELFPHLCRVNWMAPRGLKLDKEMKVCRLGKAKYALIVMAMAFSPVSKGEEIYPFFRGVRQMGMGGAAVATVNDETALFLNPAGLGKVRGPYIVIANPEIEGNYDTINGAVGNNQYSSLLTLQPFMDNIAKRNPDKHLHMKLQLLPAFITTNFAVGAHVKYSLDAEYFAATDVMHMDYVNDYAAAIGYCFRLLEGRLKIGVSGKLVNRVSVSQDIPGTSTNVTLNTLAAEGTGAGWDAGVLLTAPWKFLPTLAVVAHDIGKTHFNLGNGYFYKTGVKPEPQAQSVDAAFAIFPIHGNHTRSTWTVEYRDIQNPEAQDVFRRIHAGVEFNFGDTFFFRAGMNQRYYTAGLELVLGRQQIQLTTYGEEIGTPTRFREDRRFIFEYAFRL